MRVAIKEPAVISLGILAPCLSGSGAVETNVIVRETRLGMHLVGSDIATFPAMVAVSMFVNSHKKA